MVKQSNSPIVGVLRKINKKPNSQIVGGLRKIIKKSNSNGPFIQSMIEQTSKFQIRMKTEYDLKNNIFNIYSIFKYFNKIIE